MDWWQNSPDAKPLVLRLRATAAAMRAETAATATVPSAETPTGGVGAAERDLKLVLVQASSESTSELPTQVVRWAHPTFVEATAALQDANAGKRRIGSAGSGNGVGGVFGQASNQRQAELLTTFSAARDDDNFKNKLGAIFGGGGDKAKPPPEKVKVEVPKTMSTANESAKAKLEAMMAKQSPSNGGGGGGGGGSGDVGAAAPAAKLSADKQSAAKKLTSMFEGNGGPPPMPPPNARASEFGGMVVGNRNLGGVIKLTTDDPRFKKFLMMMKLHLPRKAVAQKMVAEGFDPSVLDKIDDSGAASAAGGGSDKEQAKGKDDGEGAGSNSPTSSSSPSSSSSSSGSSSRGVTPPGRRPGSLSSQGSAGSSSSLTSKKPGSPRAGDRKRPGSSGFAASTPRGRGKSSSSASASSPRASSSSGRGRASSGGGREERTSTSGPQSRPSGTEKKDFLKKGASEQLSTSRCAFCAFNDSGSSSIFLRFQSPLVSSRPNTKDARSKFADVKGPTEKAERVNVKRGFGRVEVSKGDKK